MKLISMEITARYEEELWKPISLEETNEELLERIRIAKDKLGTSLRILGHHYQRDEVIQFADKTGDSYGLSVYAAEETTAEFIVFCGVHFMAETADILTNDSQIVILPDLSAGCSMADMATFSQVKRAFRLISEITGEAPVPITYMNSSAEIKAFCGEHGGTVCTSSNAKLALQWGWEQNHRILFLPDQHLGRNIAFALGVPLNEMAVWDPFQPNGGLTKSQLLNSKIVLWNGYCSVHQRFLPTHVDFFRKKYPDVRILVHPECSFEVVQKSDEFGSTDYIIKRIERAAREEPNSKWAIGTEHHLVGRLQKRFQNVLKISNLAFTTCNCATMTRIDPLDLAVILEKLVDGKVENRILVKDDVKKNAKLALQKMIEITQQ
ncbi:MAG: quinolinate synthase NadA [bacterium]|nr:quinolinate synthase NadA [bacterium]